MAETVEVPEVLTDERLLEEPWLAEFVRRYRECFEYDVARRVWRRS